MSPTDLQTWVLPRDYMTQSVCLLCIAQLSFLFIVGGEYIAQFCIPHLTFNPITRFSHIFKVAQTSLPIVVKLYISVYIHTIHLVFSSSLSFSSSLFFFLFDVEAVSIYLLTYISLAPQKYKSLLFLKLKLATFPFIYLLNSN